MSKKCFECRFYSSNAALGERCHQGEIRSRVDQDFVVSPGYTELSPAREVCNKEGDGIFAYFEPKNPGAGVTFAEPVQIARRAAA